MKCDECEILDQSFIHLTSKENPHQTAPQEDADACTEQDARDLPPFA
jgi:hypothetical protein